MLYVFKYDASSKNEYIYVYKFFLIDLSYMYLLYCVHHLAFQVVISFTAKIISVMKL